MPNHEAWRFTWPPCFLTRRHVQKCGGDATPEGDADHATTGKQGRQERLILEPVPYSSARSSNPKICACRGG